MPFKEFIYGLLPLAMLITVQSGSSEPNRAGIEHPTSEQVMLILRGVSNSENPRGQLDDRSALDYARRVGFRGQVLDVAGTPSSDSEQVRRATELIRNNESISAIYGFSGGGDNARLIWQQLTPIERDRIRTVVVLGSPSVVQSHFAGTSEVVIKPDPPEGHMAGPKSLLQSLGPEEVIP